LLINFSVPIFSTTNNDATGAHFLKNYMADDKKGFPTYPFLVGDKIYLRPAVPDDIINTHYWLTQSDPDSISPVISRMVAPAEAAESYRHQKKNEMDVTLMIMKKSGDEPAGFLTSSNFNPLNRSAEINILIDPDKRRKGLGKDALKTITRYLFLQRGLNKVQAQVGGFNQSGMKLFESTGFKKDGTLRDNHFYKGEFHPTLIYSLLRYELDW